MKNLTKSILLVAVLAAFVSFASCGNAAKKAAQATADSIAAQRAADSIAAVVADSLAAALNDTIVVEEVVEAVEAAK